MASCKWRRCFAVSHPPVSLCGSAREASTRQEVMSSHSLKMSPLFAQCYHASPKNWTCSSSEKQTVRQPPSTRISAFVRAKFMLFSVTFNNTTPLTETSQFDCLGIPTCLMMTLYLVACPACQQIAIQTVPCLHMAPHALALMMWVNLTSNVMSLCKRSIASSPLSPLSLQNRMPSPLHCTSVDSCHPMLAHFHGL